MNTLKERVINLIHKRMIIGILGLICVCLRPDVAENIVTIVLAVCSVSLLDSWTKNKKADKNEG